MSPMTEAILSINRLTEILEAERTENEKLRAHIKDLHDYIWKLQQEGHFSNRSAIGGIVVQGMEEE